MFIVVPTEKRKLDMKEENTTLEAGGKVDQGALAKEKSWLILMDLIPALARGDVKAVGEVVWKMQTLGSKATEIAAHGKDIFPCMEYLYKNVEGVAVVGMSSIGPAVVVITKDSKDKLEQELKQFPMKISFVTKVDNHGHVVNKA